MRMPCRRTKPATARLWVAARISERNIGLRSTAMRAPPSDWRSEGGAGTNSAAAGSSPSCCTRCRAPSTLRLQAGHPGVVEADQPVADHETDRVRQRLAIGGPARDREAEDRRPGHLTLPVLQRPEAIVLKGEGLHGGFGGAAVDGVPGQV